MTVSFFKLDRQGMTIFITDMQSETGSTFASVDFRPSYKGKTFEDIIEQCSKHRKVEDQKALEDEIEAQLTQIYFDYTQEVKMQQESKQAKEQAGAKKGSGRIISHNVPYWRLPDAAFESIHVNGQPAFLCYDKTKFSVVSEIVIFEDEKTKKVLLPMDDFPYEKYDFSLKEIQALSTTLPINAMERAYQTIFETITPYQDTEDSNLQVDAAGIELSYFQDKFESVPYIAKIATPESGKTRSLKLVSWLAYRAMMAVDMTAANVYRYYGQEVQGAGTIIHDEIDDANIDKDTALRAIYNAGYQLGAKVPRIGGENNEKQSYYNCFGIKWFGGTEMPFSKTFGSRCIVQKLMEGIPEKIDIADEDKELFRNVRKGLLVLRLLKAFDKFEPVNTGLTGRSRELYTPLLAVVQGTKWYDKLLEPLIQLDKERHKEDRESKQAYVAKAVINRWLDAANTELKAGLKLEDEITDPLDKQLEAIKEMLFVSNDSVIANMDLTEMIDDKGKKILVNDEIPFTFTRWNVGKIQSENLKGKTDIKKIDGKVYRGHWFTLKTVKALYRRYLVTLDTKSNTRNTSTAGVDPSAGADSVDNQQETTTKDDNNAKHPVSSITKADVQTPTPPLASVTSVPSVTNFDKLIQSSGDWYWCTLHPGFKNVNKETIEHHCQYSEPEKHLAALRKLGVNV